MSLYDGDKLGFNYAMSLAPSVIGNDELIGLRANEGKLNFLSNNSIRPLYMRNNDEYLGCQIEIWEHRNGEGDYFICDGSNGLRYCFKNDLGNVGDKTSSATCTCPNKIEKIVYDIPKRQWRLRKDETSGRTLDSINLTNNCNPSKKKCSVAEQWFERSVTTT